MTPDSGSCRGIVGAIRWRAYTAAAINGYLVSRDGARYMLRGTLVQSDAFKMSMKPLVFVAPHRKGEWRWEIKSLEFRNGVVLAELHPPDAVAIVGTNPRPGGIVGIGYR